MSQEESVGVLPIISDTYVYRLPNIDWRSACRNNSHFIAYTSSIYIGRVPFNFMPFWVIDFHLGNLQTISIEFYA